MFAKRFLRVAAVSAAIALPLGLVAASPATAAKKPKPKTATVSVLHGVPNLVVDVYANDTLLIDDFAPGTLKTVKVPGGDYNLEIFPATVTDSTGTPVLQANTTFVNGKNYTVTANLYLTGSTDPATAVAPTLNVFTNNQAPILKGKNQKKGEGRVTVRHIAAAPPVNIYVNGTTASGSPLSNGNQLQAELAKGVYQAAAGLPDAGLAGVALGPVPLKVRQGWNTIAYAWGSPGAYQVAVQYVKLNLPKRS